MTTGSRVEGLRGVGSNGFIRTVANLTVTGDLVVLGENRALAGTGSFFWEDADANAEYWAFELPSGTSSQVPVVGVGIGLDGVDLGLFDGITQTTLAVLDADRDSFIAMDFSGDDAARLRANAALTISTSSASLTLTPTTDVHISNGTGLVIGHTAQITANTLAELQILGSAAVDGSAIIGLFSADTTPAELQFVKSRNASVAGNTIVTDNDLVGRLNFLPADGVDFATTAATFHAEVEDGSPAAGDIGMAFVWSTMAGGGASLTEKMRLEADGGLQFNQASSISTSTGTLTLDPTASLALTLTANTSQAQTTTDGSATYHEIDTRTTTVGVYAHKFDTANPTLASAGGAIFQLVEFGAFTLTLTGTTQVTSKQSHLNVEAMTITDTSSVTVDIASTLRIAGPPGAGGSVTITDAYALYVDAGNTRMDGALMVGAPSGGMKGAGTINAVGVYDDNSLLSDWVFEEYYAKGMELTRD